MFQFFHLPTYTSASVSLSTGDGNSARRDFLNYALSLMRSHNNEHSDSLPVIDIASLRHVAYIFDALIYYMRSGTDTDTDVLRDGISVISWQDQDENENDDHDDDINNPMMVDTESIEGDSEATGRSGRKHVFFQRSDSTLFLGCPPPDPFQTPLVQALPLADQPHLLQPNSRREDLFGVAKQTIIPSAMNSEARNVAGNDSALDKLPLQLSLSIRVPDSQTGPLPQAPGDIAGNTTATTENQSTGSASVIVRSGVYPSGPAVDTMGPFLPRFFPPLYDPDNVQRSDTTAAMAVQTNSTTRSQQPTLGVATSVTTSLPSDRSETHQASVIVHSSTAMSGNMNTTTESSVTHSVSMSSASSPVSNISQSQPSDLRATAVNIPLTSESVITTAGVASRLSVAPTIVQPTGSATASQVQTGSSVAMEMPSAGSQSLSPVVIRTSPFKIRQSPGNLIYFMFLKLIY